MDKSYFHELFTPTLKSPIFVQGLPGLGNIGKITAHLLIKFFCAKPFMELYSPFFPDYVSADSKGICHLPHYTFYAASSKDNDFIIMTGSTQPSFDDVVAQYLLSDEVLDFIEKYGCRFLITIGGIPEMKKKARVYVAATSSDLALKFMKKGAVIFRQNKIVGSSGLLLGLAQERSMEGVCFLSSTTGFMADRGAAFAVFRFLTKVLSDEEAGGRTQAMEKDL